MIAGIFHQGSGLGNQLHRYVATRVRAADLGVDFGMIETTDGSGKETGFKGKGFMNIDLGKYVEFGWVDEYCKLFHEKKVVENGVDIRGYDPEFNFIEDNTLIDGEFQDERYWKHRENEVREWLKTEPLDVPDDVCVIGFRGGEFSVFPDLFLTGDYWKQAINTMRNLGINKFEVHTDDEQMAKEYFAIWGFPVIHDIGKNWRSIRYARHAIISNSSFYILPRWLRHNETLAVTIAPRYWARRNTKVWALPQNYYDRFMYI